MLAYII